ncbi:DNA-directed RNA polymerase III subunit RPC8, partial [Dinochytrium kinnereticum]
MFLLVDLEDRVRVHPRSFWKARVAAVTDELNIKYANKVKNEVGLCICVFDVTEISDGIIHPCQDGAYMVRVSIEFFDDIVVPPELMPAGSEYDSGTGLWVWKFFDDDDQEERAFEIEKGEPIKFRVEGETFVDVEPLPKNAGITATNSESGVPPFSLT